MASPFPCDMSDRGGDGRPDRRATPRHAVPLSGRWVAEGRWVHVMVETISHRGAALSGLVRLPTGARGTLTLEGFPVPIPCDVRWSRDDVAGVAFRLTEADSGRLRTHIERHLGMGMIQLPPQPMPAGLD